jgi:hypothetical protein
MENFYVQSFAGLHKLGMYSSSKGFVPWDKEQSGSPLEVQRKQVYDKPHVGFGKLCTPEKLAFSTAALVFSGVSDYASEKTGISLGTLFGCFSTDMRYAESVNTEFPSPAYFAATLPSSAATEVAIMFKLKGPDKIFVGTDAPGFTALECALQAISNKKAESMIVLLVNGIERKDKVSPLISLDRGSSTYCYGLFISNKKSDKGINYKITLSTQGSTKSDNNSLNRNEESYFFEMINSLMQEKDFSSEYSIDGMSGSIKLVKED